MKHVRIHKMTNPEDFLSREHLDFLANCTPSCKFHSVFPISFHLTDKGEWKALSYMVVLETTSEELDKLEELKKQDMGEEDQGEDVLELNPKD